MIKKIVKNILSKLNLTTYGNVKKKKIIELIHLLRPFNLGYEYQRLGGTKDGSYIVPETLGNIKYCFSAGYGGDCSFEKNLEKYNIKSFLADYNYDAPTELKNFEYKKKFIKSYSDQKSINVNTWIENSLPIEEENMLLQIDIEGSEYEVLHAITEKNLDRFDVVIIELHNLHMVNNQIFYQYFISCLEKIKKHFEVFYLQPNNCCGVSNFDGLIFPNILEITLLSKKKIKKKEKLNPLNKNLQIKNIIEKDDIILPDYWF